MSIYRMHDAGYRDDKMGSNFSRRDALLLLGTVGLGLMVPREAHANELQAKAIYTDVSETAYGSAYGYEYQGNVSLSVNTDYGSWAATSFICNIECVPESLLFNSTIMYGNVYVKNQFITNAYCTNVFNYHIEHKGTDNIGAGVLANTLLTINDVGQLTYNQAVVIPNRSAELSAPVSSTTVLSDTSDWVLAMGMSGRIGYVRKSEMNPFTGDGVDSIQDLYALKYPSVLIDVYDMPGNKVVDQFEIKLVTK